MGLFRRKKIDDISSFLGRLRLDDYAIKRDLIVTSSTGFKYQIDALVACKKGVFCFIFKKENYVYYGNDGEFNWVKADPKTFSKIEFPSPSRYIKAATSLIETQLDLKINPVLIFLYGDVIHIDSPITFSPDSFVIRFNNLENKFGDSEFNCIKEKIEGASIQ